MSKPKSVNEALKPAEKPIISKANTCVVQCCHAAILFTPVLLRTRAPGENIKSNSNSNANPNPNLTLGQDLGIMAERSSPYIPTAAIRGTSSSLRWSPTANRTWQAEDQTAERPVHPVVTMAMSPSGTADSVPAQARSVVDQEVHEVHRFYFLLATAVGILQSGVCSTGSESLQD